MGKYKNKINLGILIVLNMVLLSFIMIVGFIVLKLIFPIDFSQNYRKIAGVENIVFQSNGAKDECYKRCFWGLERRSALAVDEKHERSVSLLEEIETFQDELYQNHIREAVLSPDGKYILYCEIEYAYTNSSLTDDEYCRYKVYNINTGEIITIYEAYKEWYNLYWCNE